MSIVSPQPRPCAGTPRWPCTHRTHTHVTRVHRAHSCRHAGDGQAEAPPQPRLCAGTPRAPLHTWSQACAHAAPSLSPPEIQADPQPRTHRPGAASQRTRPGGHGAGTRPSQVSQSSQAPHHCGPQTPGLGNNPQQTPMTASFAAGQPSANFLSRHYRRSQNSPCAYTVPHTRTRTCCPFMGPCEQRAAPTCPLYPPLPGPSTHLCPPPSAPTPARPLHLL